jgi:signal transduction histidine kinase
MTPLPVRVSRLPLRVRLVAGFSAATLFALLAAGSFVYWRVEYALDRSLDTELRQATRSLAPLIGPDGLVSNRPAADATGVAWQVLNAKGKVLDHGGPAGKTRLVSPHRLTTVGAKPRTHNTGDLLPVSPKPYRLRVSRESVSPKRYLLVAVRRDHRDEALRELLLQLTVAGLGMMLFAAVVGERLARGALSPVERYRRRAAAIAEGAADLRLDVPEGRDDEVTRLGHTFNEMLASLEHALDRERQFVNEASHELRTPITLLTSRIQLARRRTRTPAEYENILAELEIDLDRLAGLAERLLQLGASGVATEPEACDAVSTVEDVVEQRGGAEGAPKLVVDPPDLERRIALSAVGVERILTNLLDNASMHGSPPVTVTIDSPDAAWVRIAVVDAGPGMPPQLLRTAHRRFARADTARNQPGAGLGLALVEALVTQARGGLRLCCGGRHESHGQDIPIPCDHGDAMTVTVLLPVLDDPA